MTDPDQIAITLRQAAMTLANVCDGAHRRDDVGYNASDTVFGRSIAMVPAAEWDRETCFEVHRMLKKYSKQLGGHGITYSELPVPPREWCSGTTPTTRRRSLKAKAERIEGEQLRERYGRGEATREDLREHYGKRLYWAEWTGTIEIRGKILEGIAFYSPRDSDLIDAIKAIDWKVRKWNGGRCRWEVVGAGLAEVPAILDRFEFAIRDADRAKVDEGIERADRASRKAQAEAPDNVQIEKGKIVLRTPYDPAAVEAMRQIPGRRWDGQRKVNTCPLDAMASDAVLDLAERYSWTMSDSTRARLDAQGEEAKARIAASSAASADLDVQGVAEGLAPYPFQAAGIAYCLDAKRAILGDDTGLGKTPQSILVPHVADAFPALIICPKATKHHFANEVRRWLPSRSVRILNGGKISGDDAYRADYLVINYDVLTKHLDKLLTIPFQTIILDESHYIKSRKAQRSKAVIELGRLPSVVYKLALTATPILNRPVELVNQLSFLDRLDDLGGFWGFVKTYCDAKKINGYWDMKGASNLDNLAAHLRSKCMVRREKKDVAKELPALQRTEIPVELDRIEVYRRGLEDLIGWMAAKRGDASTSRSEYTAEALVRIEGLKQIVVAHKIQSCIEWIKSFLEGSDEKIVVFAHHRDVQDRLHAALACACPAKIRGGDSDSTRAAEVKRFQDDPSCRVMVASIQAAGTGLDGLQQAASNVAFVEFPWNSATLYQAESRCHRLGTDADSVNSYWLYAEGTFDSDLIGLIKEKEQILDAINQGIEVEGSVNIVEFFERLLDPDDDVDHTDRLEYSEYCDYIRER